LSLELVEAGLAHVFVIPPEAFDMQPLLDAQARARAARKGIWGTEHYQGAAHVTSLHANAEGDDTKNVNGESFRMVNLQAEPLNVIGWTVSNAAGRSFVLPDLTIPPGHTVQIRSGHGDPQRDPAKQLVIHLGSDVPVWDDHADRLTVYDRYERIVDTRAHGH
ncbi:MAG: lamin tail domain-containing protein, partial [Myxococcales bacterium]|nr:lamin tail domain-containing protein [Myxococcales bacterium]